jgi:iron(III) transport system substrate-binding protein
MIASSRAICWGCFLYCAVAAGCASNARVPEVVTYVAVDRKDAEPILKEFESQTGIHVRALYDAEAAKTTGLVTRLLAEAKRPRCDLFWNNEIVQTVALAERGLLRSYQAADAESIPAAYRDPEDRWIGIATRARVIVYNTHLVPEDKAPRTLEDLASPEWKGKLAIANPLFGTTRTHVAALYAAWGAEKTERWLQSLLDNDVRIVDGNAMVKNLVARAKPDAWPTLVGLTDTDDVLSGQADGQPLGFIYPNQQDLGTLVIPTTVCLLRNAPHTEAGERLLDFLVSAEADKRLTSPGTGYRSLRPTVGSAEESRPRTLDVGYDAVHAQLAPSTAWVSRNFRN